MPWFTLIVMLLNYLMSSRNSPAERRRAVLNSVMLGGLTYATTHYTDWGKANLGEFDGVVTPSAQTAASDGSPAGAGATISQKPNESGWAAIGKWFQPALAATGVAAVASSVGGWLPLLIIGLGAWWLLRSDNDSKVTVIERKQE